MVFKRRDRLPVHRMMGEMLYPRGGWTRAFHYVRHRVRRLPDTPERIARGVWAGVLAAFTPFYGLHFLIAFIVARLMRGNIFAALMATFFGNPLTYVPIGVISLKTGHWLLGTEFDEGEKLAFGSKFASAAKDLWDNIKALFNDAPRDWTDLRIFFDEIFFPYLVGGIIPGVICASICYILTVPVIRAYQNRRRKRIKAKFDAIKKMADLEADETAPAD